MYKRTCTHTHALVHTHTLTHTHTHTHTRTHVCKHTHTVHTHTHINTCLQTHTHTCTHLHTHTHTHLLTHTHTHAHAHTRLQTRTHTYIHTHIHTHTYTHTCVHVCVCTYHSSSTYSKGELAALQLNHLFPKDLTKFNHCIYMSNQQQLNYSTLPSNCHFMNGTNRAPVALVSFPGSGNTWVRGLLEMATGICTGTVMIVTMQDVLLVHA